MTDPGVLCSAHHAPLYEDVHDGEPMGRYLCPEPGCTSVLAAETLAAVRDQAWCSDNGMTAPGWKTLNAGQDPPAPAGAAGEDGDHDR